MTHEPYDIDFTQKFHSPAIFGCIATYNGGDPAHLRQLVLVQELLEVVGVLRPTDCDRNDYHTHIYSDYNHNYDQNYDFDLP